MAWRRWQRHKANKAENLAIRMYLERRAAHRALCEVIVDAHRLAEAHWRLDEALEHTRPVSR
jgi:hypothetical protein